MAEKRAHRSITIDQKVKILDQIGKKSYKILAEKRRSCVNKFGYNNRAARFGLQTEDFRYGLSKINKDNEIGKEKQLEEALFLERAGSKKMYEHYKSRKEQTTVPTIHHI